LIEKYNADFIAGGSVQNSLRVAQWIIKKPNIAVFFGCVGEDEYSKTLETRARNDGVNVIYQRKSDVSTGTCAVLITGSHRSLCANLGAANHFSIDHLSANCKFIENAQFYYISGFFLTVSPPSILKVAEHALQKNRLFMMNLSAPFISQFYKEPLMQAMPYIDILFGNEMEGVAFAKEMNFGTENLKEIGMKIYNLPKLNEKRKRIVVLTQGCSPVLLFENGTIREFDVVPLQPEEIVDTNGAGDAFVGGFLSQLVQNNSLDLCVKCGIWAARQIIQRNGVSLDGESNFVPGDV
jgi:adenosine kinase